MIEIALKLASFGLAVIPLKNLDKRPLSGSHGVKDATKDPELIKKIWKATPKANVGIALGEVSGVVAVDCDNGFKAQDLSLFPRTITVRTKNGFHLYFLYTPGLKNRGLFGGATNKGTATLKSNGVYTVGPGSTVAHPDGTLWDYEYLNDKGGELSFDEMKPAEPPDFFLEDHDTHTPKKPNSSNQDALPIYKKGQRRDQFKAIVTAMRCRGETSEAILRELLLVNQTQCLPPMTKKEFHQDVSAKPQGLLHFIPDKAVVAVRQEKENSKEQWVKCLGHNRDGKYFFTTSSNRTIREISSGTMSPKAFLDLMPLNYWEDTYSETKFTKQGKAYQYLDWEKVESLLKDKCRKRGIYSESIERGLGAWRDRARLVLHLGDRLCVEGVEYGLDEFQTDYIYELKETLPSIAPTPLTVKECEVVLDACNSLNWTNKKSSGLLLAAWCALAPLCGALPWRPHIWLSGNAGCGKSTIKKDIIESIIPNKMACYATGGSTPAGIRQWIMRDSKAVIQDEAESDDYGAEKRILGILELARQASLEDDNMIAKGTTGHKAVKFKCASMFCLLGIKDNIHKEADNTRFTQLELLDPKKEDWGGTNGIEAKLKRLTKDISERLFARMIANYSNIIETQRIFANVLRKTDNARLGQQLGTLLAGYWFLISDTPPTDQEAYNLIGEINYTTSGYQEKSIPEQEKCIGILLSHVLKYHTEEEFGASTTTHYWEEPISGIITLCMKEKNSQHQNALENIGLKYDSERDALFVSSDNYTLKKIYRSYEWRTPWKKMLKKIPGSESTRLRIKGVRNSGYSVPLKEIIDEGEDE